LDSIDRAIDCRVDALVRVEGSFSSAGVQVPRVTLTSHDGAGLLTINISALDLGRIARSDHEFPCTDEQLGVGLLVKTREIYGRVRAHAESRSEYGLLSFGIASYLGRELRPAFSNVTSDSFLRLMVPIDQVDRHPDQVRAAISEINFVVDQVFLVGGDDAFAMTMEMFGLVPDVDDLVLPPEPEPTEDELLGDSMLPPQRLPPTDFSAEQLWEMMGKEAEVLPLNHVSLMGIRKRFRPIESTDTTLDIRLPISQSEVSLYRRMGITDYADALRREFEERSARIGVRIGKMLSSWLNVTRRTDDDRHEYLHFRVEFKSSADDDEAARASERAYIAGFILDLLATPGLKGMFRAPEAPIL